MAKHRKVFYPKASHGQREQIVPEGGGPEDVLGGGLAGLQFGIQASKFAPDPISKAIVIGGSALIGTGIGLVNKNKKNELVKETEESNKYIEEQNRLYGGHYQYESPEEQMYAKHGYVLPEEYKHGGLYHSNRLRGKQKMNTSFIPNPAKFKTLKKDSLKMSKKDLVKEVNKLSKESEFKMPRYYEEPLVLSSRRALHGHRDDLEQYHNLPPEEYKSAVESAYEGQEGYTTIEMEGGEPVFRQAEDKQGNKTGRVRLVKYSPNAATHEEGGDLYEAKHGDFILPDYQAKKGLAAYDNGDYDTLKSMRLNLPNTGEMREGENLDYTEPYRETTAQHGKDFDFFETATAAATTQKGIPYEETKTELELGYEGEDVPSLYDFRTTFEDEGKSNERIEEKNQRINKGITTAAELAPSLYDIGVGLFSKPTKYEPPTFKRSEEAIDEFRNFNLDVSPQIEQIERDKRAAHERSRMTGMPQANFYQIEAQSNRAKNQVLVNKTNMEARVKLEAPKLAYQLGITEGQAAQQAKLMTQQAGAMKRDYLEKGLEGLSKYTIGTVSNRQLLDLLVSKGYITEQEKKGLE